MPRAGCGLGNGWPSRLLRGAARAIPTLLFPQDNACHLCGRGLREGEHLLCEACEAALRMLRLAPEEAALELGGRVPCVTAYRYEGAARALDLQLKYGCNHFAALPLAAGLCAAYADAPDLHCAPLVTPVPLHPKRERDRGYNQSEVLARRFCEHTGLVCAPGLVRRVRHTQPQSQKTREQRLVGMLGAFEADKAARGQRVLLIDDVLTTGSTLLACAEALFEAGAWDVTAMTASRA